ncbi:hypothetical protein [Verrucomicrobium sp. BvORR106]|uniref:hypothetical protein n=1 Tax=Verrucomicrobium sp. BvORR106 TaxID=1403819 RepID=UPI00056F5D24|nr:hypothetical protein [Verrucomicrobium sp. BvORR106]
MESVAKLIARSGGKVAGESAVSSEVERLLDEVGELGRAANNPDFQRRIIRAQFRRASTVPRMSDVLFWSDIPVGVVVGDGVRRSQSLVMVCPFDAVVATSEVGEGSSVRWGPSVVRIYREGTNVLTVRRHSTARSKWEIWRVSSQHWSITDAHGNEIWRVTSVDRWLLGANSLRAKHSETAMEFVFRLSSNHYEMSKLDQSYGNHKNVLSAEALTSGLPEDDLDALFLANIVFRFMIFNFDYDSGS